MKKDFKESKNTIHHNSDNCTVIVLIHQKKELLVSNVLLKLP